MGVMGIAVFQGFAGGFFDTGRCIKIGLADLQVNDAGTAPLQFLGPFKNIHHNKGRHFFGAFGYHFQK